MLRISIIIPVFKVEEYIANCLKSVIGQESEGYELECILVDDCSPDNSMDVAKSVISSYHGRIQFIYIIQEKNKGQSAARNEAMKQATGDYVFFLDSDDYLYPNSITAMVKSLGNLPNADFVEGAYHSGKDNRNYPAKPEFHLLNDKNTLLLHLYSNKVSHLACNKLIRRKTIIDNKLFFVEGIIFEDIHWTHRLCHCSSRAVIIPNVTYEYVFNAKSTSNASHLNATKSISSFAFVLDSFLDTDEKEAYVDHKLFIFHYMLNAMDIQRKGYVSKEATSHLTSVKKRLLRQVFCDTRIILTLFFLLMFKPFSYLLRMAFFRHQIHRMEKGVSFLGKKTDWIHHLWH